MTEAEGEEFRRVAQLQYQEIEKLRALLRWKDQELGRKEQELDVLVGWIAGEADAHSALQAIYADPRSSPANKIKAAASALPFEKSKPASVSVVIDFKERVRNARLRQLELDKAEWARQEARLDLDAEPAPTILGGHDGDPAARSLPHSVTLGSEAALNHSNIS
jgi:hypothetical protein